LGCFSAQLPSVVAAQPPALSRQRRSAGTRGLLEQRPFAEDEQGRQIRPSGEPADAHPGQQPAALGHRCPGEPSVTGGTGPKYAFEADEAGRQSAARRRAAVLVCDGAAGWQNQVGWRQGWTGGIGVRFAWGPQSTSLEQQLNQPARPAADVEADARPQVLTD
jgi:hypothetical protein